MAIYPTIEGFKGITGMIPKRGEVLFGPREVEGDVIPMKATHSSHFGFQKVERKKDDFISDFANTLKEAFFKVNDLQLQADQLTLALAVRPDTVDIHDVTIAAEKARMAILFTKSVIERVTQGFRELSNLR